MVVSWELGREVMGAPEEIVYFLAVVEGEDVLAAGVDEVLVDVVHAVVQDYVTNAEFFVIGEVLGIAVYVLQYLL